MFGIDGRKKSLRTLTERLARLRTRVPPSALAFHCNADRLQAAITARLGAPALMIKANEVQALQERFEALRELAEGISAVRAEAGPLHDAEQAFAADLARLDDAEIAAWFAARSSRRADWIAGAGGDASESAALAEHRERLGTCRKQQAGDRRLFDLLAEAGQRLATLGAAGQTQELAQGLTVLRRQLLQEGPTRDGVERLRELLKSLRAFQPRAKPPLIEEAYERLVRMDDWIKELKDGPVGRARAQPPAGHLPDARENALRALTKRYFDLSQDWQNHEDAVFAGLLTEIRELEGRLVAQAHAEHAASTAELERNRRMFQQFSDPGLSPGLAEEIADLLSRTPATPESFRGWRERCRRARERFEAAIDAESHRIEPLCVTLDHEIADQIEQIQTFPLAAADRTACAAILRALAAARRPSATHERVPDLLAWMQELHLLGERARHLFASVSKKARRQARRDQCLRVRAARLRQLAAALDEPAGELLAALSAAVGESPAGREPAADQLAQDRRLLAGVQPELLQRCAARLAARYQALTQLQALCDEDPAVCAPELERLSRAAPTPRLRNLEALLASVPMLEAAVQSALTKQTERLLEGRTGLLAALAGSDRKGLSGPDRDALERLLAALRECDQTRCKDPQRLLPSLRNLNAQGRRLLERIEGAQRDLEALTRQLNQRLGRLQNDYFEVGSQALVERIWALIQPVVGVCSSHAARAMQLREAARLLSALEDHAHRSAAAQFSLHWNKIKDLVDPQAQELVREIGAKPLALPSLEHRQRVRDFANRNR